jgi:hypothetical protein
VDVLGGGRPSVLRSVLGVGGAGVKDDEVEPTGEI